MQIISDGIYLKKLPPEIVAKRWDTIGYYIQQAIDQSDNPFGGGNLLAAIESNELICWGVLKVRGEIVDLIALVTSLVGGDRLLGGRDFVLYSVTAIKNLKREDYETCLSLFEEEAKDAKCTAITTYVKDPRFVELSKGLGFTVKHLIRKEF
jgi:hypothetical protein